MVLDSREYNEKDLKKLVYKHVLVSFINMDDRIHCASSETAVVNAVFPQHTSIKFQDFFFFFFLQPDRWKKYWMNDCI